MSETNIEIALLARLKAMLPAISTAWPNMGFTPVTGTPWQRVAVLRAEPLAAFHGSTGKPVYRSGILSVTLFYPPEQGSGAAMTRAEAIVAHFPRALSLSQGDTSLRIADEPRILPALPEAAWYALPVHIPYYSYDFG